MVGDAGIYECTESIEVTMTRKTARTIAWRESKIQRTTPGEHGETNRE